MDKFCLRWKEFEPNITRSFKKLRHEEDFSDVTLMGDDFKPMSAHKVVLSSCSEYFKNVLHNSQKHSHPVLCLEGLRNADLTNILDYIYNGELNIYQEDLDRFLMIAQRLKLEGLIGQEEQINKTEDFQENDLLPLNDKETLSNLRNSVAKSLEDKNSIVQSEDYHNLDEKLNQMFSRDQSGMFSCHNCPMKSNKTTNMRDHVETHVEGLQFDCNFCSKPQRYRNRNSLRNHISKYHKTQN